MSRRQLATQWDTAFDLASSAEDSTLLMPSRPVAGGGGVYLVDSYAGRILHFDRAGRLVWHFGRKGRGPDELRRVRDLKVDAAGQVWALDQGNGRVTVLSPEGAVAARVPLAGLGRAPESVVPLRNGELLVAVHDPQAPFVRMKTDGTVVARDTFPWAPYRRMEDLATQFVTAADPASGAWVAAFSMGDGFFAFRGTRWAGYRGWYVEHVAFPEVERRSSGPSVMTGLKGSPVESATSVTLSPTRMYVLFGGASGFGRRVIDSYSLADGAYQGSYLLPRRVDQIGWSADGFYVIFDAPYPHLALLKPRGAALP